MEIDSYTHAGIPTFYLGTHQPAWLGQVPVPLFISHRRLARCRRLPVARTTWALDSGAFSELGMHGRWTLMPEAYAKAVRRYRDEIGRLAWAAPQDWLCEPAVRAVTGFGVREHQYRTVSNLLDLRRIAPDLPIIPVLQGWTLADYLRCVELYRQAGIDLRSEALVGLGSVCRRQATAEIGRIVERLTDLGLRLHGFGIKTLGLRRYGRFLASADSLAWSFRGRHVKPCRHQREERVSEANCLIFALGWRRHVLQEKGCCYRAPVQTRCRAVRSGDRAHVVGTSSGEKYELNGEGDHGTTTSRR
jgi:hypothetical protein